MSETVAKTKRRKIVAENVVEEKPVKSTRGRKPKKETENIQEQEISSMPDLSSEQEIFSGRSLLMIIPTHLLMILPQKNNIKENSFIKRHLPKNKFPRKIPQRKHF